MQGIMGFKRPIEDGDFQDFSLKHPKQVDFSNELTSLSEMYPILEETQEIGVPGDSLYSKLQCGELEDNSRTVMSESAEKAFEISAPSSWATSSTSDEDSGSVPPFSFSYSPNYVEYRFPRRSVPQFEDTYSSLLESSPRKQVPTGTNHQAEVPVWNPQATEKYSLDSDHIVDDRGEKLMGDCVCVLSDPELSTQSDDMAGNGRKDCGCPDQGSHRCVQQHVKEARESLRIALGPEKFERLGLCDMGEEVSEKWNEDEERVFHEVVYTNPVSRDKNFWDHLSTVFSSRTMKEIVSYYFNVFMLRRRSVQNRSQFLDIDSDDDEWNVSYLGLIGFEQEDEDSEMDSPLLLNEEIDVSYEDDCCLINNGADKDDDKGDCKVGLHENGGGQGDDGLDPGYLLEPCSAKIWDDSFPMSPLKAVDLLPTGKMIEEIFGPCTQNGRSVM